MLNKISTNPPKGFTKEEAKKQLKKNLHKIIALQKKMNAQSKYSLLVVFQGLDASGKDGATRVVFSGINPAGINVHSFKKPTEEEFAHDFLWRVHKHAPAKGMIQVFNRSHYEDILVPSVEGYFTEKQVSKRYALINHFEDTLAHNNTKILKFYLHNSPENQLIRLKERINMTEKHWKHNDGDWEVREKRAQYHRVYEKIFKQCDQPKWIIVPSDKNWYKSLIISNEVLRALQKMELEWPTLKSQKFKEDDL